MGIRRRELTEDDLRWMRRAVDLGKQSIPEGSRPSTPPKVGVVIADTSGLVGESFRGETGPGDHAEYGLLERLKDVDLTGTTVYTTLEPCSRRSPEKQPCAIRLITRRVATVFIGIYDPDPRIHREGWRMLRDTGVELCDFDESLRGELRGDNVSFIDRFRFGTGTTGTAAFDYLQNSGEFAIYSDDSHGTVFHTAWTMGGKGAIYAVDHTHLVAVPRYAQSFEDVDDPGAHEFANFTQRVEEGTLVIFRNDAGFAVVRIESVLSGPRYGDDRTELQIEWQLRLP
jgi:diaminohydroxyphosphoribosylaminopyrimidine deaminase/5-amino-6-(5-phosphoribosylamino)uracil reductase